MQRRTVLHATMVVVVIGAAGLAGYDAGILPPQDVDKHDRADVTIVDENGTVLATVEARVADTSEERFTGLSDTESLENGSGMLFVHARDGRKAYVMRDMDFPLDMIFVGADKNITTIREAPLPPPDADQLKRYTGQGKWVLEVPRGFTDAHGIEPGDRIYIQYYD